MTVCLEGCAGRHFQICQNDKNVSLKICFFFIEEMPSVIKITPVLKASHIKAEIGALRVSGTSLTIGGLLINSMFYLLCFLLENKEIHTSR